MPPTHSLDVTVPTEATPAARCPHCDRPFPTERLEALHVGEAHAGDLDAEAVAAYEDAVEAEADELFVFHMKVVVAIVLLFMGIAYTYAFVLS